MAAHLFVSEIEEPEVLEEDRHHIERVLRLRPGERLTVSDGLGRWRECTWQTGAQLVATSEIQLEKERRPIAVGFALTKGDKGAFVVQKLTECGVDRIIPFVAERSIVRWDSEKAATAVARWRKIARESAMQSHRTRLPTVEDVAAFSDVATQPGVALADGTGLPLSTAIDCVLVGPEGGWSDQELRVGGERVALASTVLRAETAAIAAGVLLSAMRSHLVHPATRL